MRHPVDLEELLAQAQALRIGIEAARAALVVAASAVGAPRPPKLAQVAGALAVQAAHMDVLRERAEELAAELERHLDASVKSAKRRPPLGVVGA